MAWATRTFTAAATGARGDARPGSDLDAAVEHDSDHATWAELVSVVEEQAPTLLDIELVDGGRASESLREVVAREARVLYG